MYVSGSSLWVTRGDDQHGRIPYFSYSIPNYRERCGVSRIIMLIRTTQTHTFWYLKGPSSDHTTSIQGTNFKVLNYIMLIIMLVYTIYIKTFPKHLNRASNGTAICSRKFAKGHFIYSKYIVAHMKVGETWSIINNLTTNLQTLIIVWPMKSRG